MQGHISPRESCRMFIYPSATLSPSVTLRVSRSLPDSPTVCLFSRQPLVVVDTI